jgi:hypothetical protein
MRAALAQYFAHRQNGLAARFMVSRNGVDELLDLLRRGQSCEHCKLAAAERKIVTRGPANRWHRADVFRRLTGVIIATVAVDGVGNIPP